MSPARSCSPPVGLCRARWRSPSRHPPDGEPARGGPPRSSTPAPAVQSHDSSSHACRRAPRRRPQARQAAGHSWLDLLLISGAIAYHAFTRRGWLPARASSGWWEPAVNLIGCAFFGISAAAGDAAGSTGWPPGPTIANWNVSLGAARETALAGYLECWRATAGRAQPGGIGPSCASVRAWLTDRSPVDGDPLVDEAARDWAARDYKRHLKKVEQWRQASVNLALASLDSFYSYLGRGRPVGPPGGAAGPCAARVVARGSTAAAALSGAGFVAGSRNRVALL